MYAVAILCSFKKIKALAVSAMPFHNGVMFQIVIVAASSVVAKSVFNPSDL